MGSPRRPWEDRAVPSVSDDASPWTPRGGVESLSVCFACFLACLFVCMYAFAQY